MSQRLDSCANMQSRYRRFIMAGIAASFILCFVGLLHAIPRDHPAHQVLVQSKHPVGRQFFSDWYVIQVAASNESEALYQAKQISGVIQAELDAPLHLHQTPSPEPTCTLAEWYIKNSGQFGGPNTIGIDTRALGAWDILRTLQSPDPVRIAIMDSGVNTLHPRFTGVTFYAQKHFTDDCNSTEDCSSYGDVYGHGTAVMGVIVAMLPDPSWYTLGSYRVFDGTGTTSYSVLLQGMQEAVADGAQIINFSGGGRERSEAAYEFLESHPEILFIFSAGNSSERPPDYPAHDDHLPNVVSVSAIEQSGALTGFTNTGALLAAPGQYIFTSMDLCQPRPVAMCQQAGFGFLNGTSFSSPIVLAACVGRILMHPHESAAAVRQKLLDSVDVNSMYEGHLASRGRVNFEKFIQLP